MYKWDEMNRRERDALIHQNIFNIDMAGFKTPSGYTANSLVKDEENRTTWIDVPYYTADILAAWEVVEKFHEHNFLVNYLTDEIPGLSKIGWHAAFDDEHAMGCETAPEAICIAALKMIGVEIR